MNIADLPELLVEAGIATPEQAQTLTKLIEDRTREAWEVAAEPATKATR